MKQSEQLDNEKRKQKLERSLNTPVRTNTSQATTNVAPSKPADTNFRESNFEDDLARAREKISSKGGGFTEAEKRYVQRTKHAIKENVERNMERFADSKYASALNGVKKRMEINGYDISGDNVGGNVAKLMNEYEQRVAKETSNEQGEVVFKRPTKNYINKTIEKEVIRENKETESTSDNDGIYVKKDELKKIIAKTAAYAAKKAVKEMMSNVQGEEDELSFVYGGKLFKTKIFEIVDLEDKN